MNEIERALQAGPETPETAGLTERLKDTVDSSLARASSTAPPAATTITTASLSTSALLAGVVVVMVAGLVVFSIDRGPSSGPQKVIEGSSRSSQPAATDPSSSGGAGSFVDSQGEMSTNGIQESSRNTDEAESEKDPVAAVVTPAVFGQVVDEHGSPLGGAEVLVKLYEGGRVALASALSGPDGRYEIPVRGLLQGRLEKIEAELPDGLDIRQIKKSKKLPKVEKQRLLSDQELRERIERALAPSESAKTVRYRALLEERERQVKAEEDRRRQLERRWAEREERESAEDHEEEDHEEQDNEKRERALRERREIESQYAELRSEEQRVDFTFCANAVLEGYQPSPEYEFHLAGNERLELNLTLREAELIHGVVVDPSGVPIPEARVVVCATTSEVAIASEALETTTDPAGRFEFALAPERYAVLIRARGWQEREIVIEASPRPIEVRLSEAGILHVDVFDEPGETLANLRLEVYQGERRVQTQRARDGDRTTFENLHPGDYRVKLFQGEQVFPLAEERVRVAVAEEVALELELDRGVPINGQVRIPPSIEDPPQILVLAYRAGTEYFRGAVARVDENGAFEYELLPAGDYVFAIACLEESGWKLCRFEDVQLSHGNGPQHVTLDYQKAEFCSLDVRVRNAAGYGVPFASVTLSRQRTGSRATLKANGKGDFHIDMHPDTFEVRVNADGYKAKELAALQLRSGQQQEIEIVLERVGNLYETIVKLLPERQDLTMRGSIRLRSLLSIVERAHPGVLVIAPELESSAKLEQIFVEGRGCVDLREVLCRAIERHELEWAYEDQRLHIR